MLNNTRHELKGVRVSLEPTLLHTSSSYIGNGQCCSIELGNSLCRAVGLKEDWQRARRACRDSLHQVHKYRASVVGVYEGVVLERKHHVVCVHLHARRADSCRSSTVDP